MCGGVCKFKLLDLTVPSRASNVSHTVVLRPLKAGYFNFTSASVSYLAQEGGQVLVTAVYHLSGFRHDQTVLEGLDTFVLKGMPAVFVTFT